MKHSVLVARINTKLIKINMVASGLSPATILSIGPAKVITMTDMPREQAIYLLSANSVDKFRALHAWMRASKTIPTFTAAIVKKYGTESS